MLLLMATSEPAGKSWGLLGQEEQKLIDSDVAVWEPGPRWMTKCLAKVFMGVDGLLAEAAATSSSWSWSWS